MASKEILAGIANLEAGVNTAVDPAFLPVNQAAGAVNMTFRSGFAETRPDFRQINLHFPDEATAEAFAAGRFQGARYFEAQGEGALVAVIDGTPYYVSPHHEVTPIDVPLLSKDVQRVKFLDTGQHLIIADGVNDPLIITGKAGRRSNPQAVSPYTGKTGELGPGYEMAYIAGQICKVIKDRSNFVVGDPAIPGVAPDNCLFDTLGQYLAGAGAFEALGPITALSSIPQLDVPDGVGPLLVWTRDSVESYQIDIARSHWGNQVISRKILARGTESQDSLIQVNNDILFRNRDGIYSIRTARAEADGRIFLALSRAATAYLEKDFRGLLQYTTGMLFDNRSFMSCSPRRMELADGREDIYFEGAVVFDHEIEASPRAAGAELAEGVWTGLRITGMATGRLAGEDRGFFFGKRDGRNVLVEIMQDSTGYDDFERPVEQMLFTRALFEPSWWKAKTPKAVALWLSHVEDRTTVDVLARFDNAPSYVPFTREPLVFSGDVCQTAECNPPTLNNPRPGPFARIFSPRYAASPVPEVFRTQFLFKITGRARLDQVQYNTVPEDDSPRGGTLTGKIEHSQTVDGCAINHYEYTP